VNRILLSFSLLIVCILSLAVHIDNADYWAINIVSHFPAQYALVSLVLSALCFYRKSILLCVFAVILFIMNTSLVIERNNEAYAGVDKLKTFKVYSANLNQHNRDLSKLKHELKTVNADIVLLMEVTPEQIGQLVPLMENFPYCIRKIPIGTENVGMVFLSKFPVLSHQVIKLSEHGNGIIKAELSINHKPVIFYGIHFPKTTSMKEFPERKRQLTWFAQQINKESMQVIVAGDLNATPYSPGFRKLLRISGLKDTRRGFGWLPSWPAYFPPLWIPIDHILVGPEIQVYRRSTGSFIGSDHFPVIAEISIG
jgi:endonuclease/exonuclease/phosphatase family metal-dependent hydrolase